MKTDFKKVLSKSFLQNQFLTENKERNTTFPNLNRTIQ
ncbi:hypothetical protein LEP1GSC188_2229 [Leptospira weilii serovar Topaz str. LT2116]|uniref:Uncharacterized protein n=1 Tax=Leptospira weilii serovar Topaz str. LT2116 TaxID=1088540 RepID=M3GXK8_9LEPT|nr:hypothetical protein LEP1GSC188_2229 [Leptospira weilii serovar Topaz str. LT2116]